MTLLFVITNGVLKVLSWVVTVVFSCFWKACARVACEAWQCWIWPSRPTRVKFCMLLNVFGATLRFWLRERLSRFWGVSSTMALQFVLLDGRCGILVLWFGLGDAPEREGSHFVLVISRDFCRSPAKEFSSVWSQDEFLARHIACLLLTRFFAFLLDALCRFVGGGHLGPGRSCLQFSASLVWSTTGWRLSSYRLLWTT